MIDTIIPRLVPLWIEKLLPIFYSTWHIHWKWVWEHGDLSALFTEAHKG
jgi:hypothetical protein